MSPMIVTVAGALLALSTQVFAAEVKLDTRSCYAGQSHVIQSDGITSVSFAIVGMLPGSADSPPPLQMMSARCLGALSIINGQLDENGTCEAVNAGGDKMFWTFARKGDPAKAEGTWHMVQGTGKLADITGDGKWMPIGVFPPIEQGTTTACNHEWGTMNIK